MDCDIYLCCCECGEAPSACSPGSHSNTWDINTGFRPCQLAVFGPGLGAVSVAGTSAGVDLSVGCKDSNYDANAMRCHAKPRSRQQCPKYHHHRLHMQCMRCMSLSLPLGVATMLAWKYWLPYLFNVFMRRGADARREMVSRARTYVCLGRSTSVITFTCGEKQRVVVVIWVLFSVFCCVLYIQQSRARGW